MRKQYVTPEIECFQVITENVVMLSAGMGGDMDGDNTANAPAFDYEW